MCMYAKLIEHNLVGQQEIRKANFGGDHTPYLTLNVPFSRTDVFKNNILFLFGSVICGTIYLLV